MARKTINYNEIKRTTDAADRLGIVQRELSEYDIDNPPYLSDALANMHSGGADVLEYLSRQEREAMESGERSFTWTIRKISDEWGQPPKPGDLAERKISKNLKDANGNLTTCADRNASMVAGTYDQDFYRTVEYKLDEKGCFKCGFQAAVSFLNTKGIHGYSGRPLPRNTHPPTHGEAEKLPDGTHRTRHYWLYREVDAAQYEAEPTLKTEPAEADKPKRGRKPKKDKE